MFENPNVLVFLTCCVGPAGFFGVGFYLGRIIERRGMPRGLVWSKQNDEL